MIKIQSITNRALGFTPYKAGNQIGWIKSATDSSGITRTIKKLPSGTIIKDSTTPTDLTIKKRILTSSGKEIKSYLSTDAKHRMIYINDKKHPEYTTVSKTNGMYDFSKEKPIADTQQTYYQKIYTAFEKIKMHLGII